MTRLTCQPVARSAHCSRLTQRRAASTGDVESGFTSCFSGHPHALMCWDELNAEHQCTSATPAPLDVWGHYRLQAGYCGPARRSGAQDGPPSQGPLRLPLPDASACTCSYRMCIRKWLHFQRRLQGGQAVGRGRLATARSSAPPCSRRFRVPPPLIQNQLAGIDLLHALKPGRLHVRVTRNSAERCVPRAAQARILMSELSPNAQHQTMKHPGLKGGWATSG